MSTSWANNTQLIGRLSRRLTFLDFSIMCLILTISDKLIERGWEECRGMGASFGYNRNEELHDYETAESLITTLIEIVPKGETYF